MVSKAIRIRATGDLGEKVQGRIPQPVGLDDGLERAILAVVTELDAVRVEGRSARLFGGLLDPARGTKRNSASLSTKRLMSHGHATLSTCTCERVIHFIARPPLIRYGFRGRPARRITQYNDLTAWDET